MFTNGEWAWAPTDEADKKMVQAMKRGAKATLTGRSSRGTKTEDTFSLKGFTAAVEDASKRCK
jgi:invasion protein IalB